jgi:imidazolonepropionase-like amidohydrolase
MLLIVILGLLLSPAAAPLETGTFRLHKFAQPIGTETYTVTRENDSLTLESHFSFTDRGTTVPLTATLTAATDYTPRTFTIAGSTSRLSKIDVAVELTGTTAHIRDGQDTRTVPLPPSAFTIAGYAPVALEMALMRYWRAHGSPASLPVLPSGRVEIRDRGADTISVDGRQLTLQRYSVKGLVWGIETLWMDRDGSLAAVVTRDAEFDHFEALRDGLEPALSTFIATAARDEMRELEELSASLAGRRSGTLAFTGATLIRGTDDPPVPHATIVTRGGRIVAAGPEGSTPIPPDAARIDVAGRYIIPGLWDMHAHYEQVEWGPIYLAAGVTTVRDVGNELEFIAAVRDAIREGRGLGPRMLLAGIVDGDGPITLGVARVTNAADAARWVARYHDAGFEQIKIYSSLSEENVRAVCREAHARGMTVTGHIPNGMDIYQGVTDGMDQVDHLQYVMAALRPVGFDPSKASGLDRLKASAAIDVTSPAATRLIAFLKDHHTVIDDTTALFEQIFRSSAQPAASIEPGVAHVAPELREQLTNGGMGAGQGDLLKSIRQRLVELLRALHTGGVTLVAGTDQAVPGYSVYRELELYVEAGFTPLQALQAATIVPARVMRVDGDSGTIQAGKRADFAILDKDPLSDIHNIRSVRSVVANGTLYESAPLWTSVGFTP